MPTRRKVKTPARTAPAAVLADAELVPLDESVHVWPGRHIDVGGWRAHVRSTPTTATDAEPALFIHGLGGSALNWTDLAAVLLNRLAIESIDLAGHGRSGPAGHGRSGPAGHGRSGPAPNNAYGVGAHADRVIAYLEQSDRGPVHLVGNSMGGAISIVIAARRPDLVRTLTLISPAVPDNRVRVYPLRNDPRMAMLAIPVIGEAVMKRFNAKVGAEQRVRGTIAVCFADPSRYPEARLREAVAEAKDRANLPWAGSAFLRSMRALAQSQILRGRRGWATMGAIAAPTLVLWGEDDRLVAPDLAPFVAAAIPDSRLLVLPDIGHTAQMEDPVTTARAILGLTFAEV